LLLSDYAMAIMANGRFQTKSMLQIDQNVVNRISEARDMSERDIKEIGMIMHWLPRTRRFLMGDMRIGERTGVSWDSIIEQFRQPTCVGSVHTHPYREKLGPEAEIGFSFGDFVFYAEQFPLWMPFSLNFVVSNTRLFLAVYRLATTKVINNTLYNQLNTDEKGADAYLNQRGKLQESYALDTNTSVLQSQGKTAESARLERGFFGGIAGYIPLRMSLNRAMIKQAAQTMRFEAYEGRLGGTLHLQSHRVYQGRG
jgi:hypothetical protein